MATTQAVLPLLHHHLARIIPSSSSVPEPVKALLRERFVTNAARNLFLARSLVTVLDLLRGEGVRAIPYKGIVLAANVYGDLRLRQTSDLDLLVSEQDYLPSRELLLANGYRLTPGLDLGWECALRSPDGRVEIDLHRALLPSWVGVGFDFEELWSRCDLRLLGESAVPDLCAEDALILLCLLLVKDSAEGKLVLRQVCDIAELLRAHPDLDWQRVQDTAQHKGIPHELGLALCVTDRLYPLTLPPQMRGYVDGGAARESLIQQALGLVAEGSRVKRPFLARAWREHLFLIRTRAGWRAKWQLLLLAAHRLSLVVVVPAASDRAGVPLSSGWSALHYVIRPFRLLTKYLIVAPLRAAARHWVRSTQNARRQDG